MILIALIRISKWKGAIPTISLSSLWGSKFKYFIGSVAVSKAPIGAKYF